MEIHFSLRNFLKNDFHLCDILKPIIKRLGGKIRKIKYFQKYIPRHDLYVEPFFGGGAVFWHLQPKHAIINDFDSLLINFLTQLRDHSDELLEKINNLIAIGNYHEQYYKFRKAMNEEKNLSNLDKAVIFFFINKLSYRGLMRFNQKNQFNTPFGHYKNFTHQITQEHVNLLRSTTILNQDYSQLLLQYDCKNTFFFLDPPYHNTNNNYYASAKFDEQDHKILAQNVKNIKNAKFLLTINKTPLTEELYRDFIIDKYSCSQAIFHGGAKNTILIGN